MNTTSNKIVFASSIPEEAWTVKDIIGEQFTFDLIFDICDALKLDDDGDIFWAVKREVLASRYIEGLNNNI